ncbi:MAG: hemolysin family protein [Myxococcota bacterium]
MEADIALRIILFVSCLACSAFFAGSETALFSLGRVHLAKLRQDGHSRLGLVERLLARPRRLIATIFIGNELVNITGTALVAAVVDRYAHPLGEVAVVLIATAITVPAILLFGEITPKNIAQQVTVGWAVRAAPVLEALARLLAPLRIIVETIADATVRLVGRRVTSAAPPGDVGEGEFRTLVDVARHEGQIDPRERQLIHRVLELGERTVAQLMMPIEKVFAVSVNLPVTRIIEEVRGSIYSRIPVYEGSRERVIGILHTKDLLAVARNLPGERRVREMLHEPFFVPRQARCEALLRDFRKRKVHLAIVVDEYGRMIGLITLEDVLEELFGEIVDEKEREVAGGDPGIEGEEPKAS